MTNDNIIKVSACWNSGVQKAFWSSWLRVLGSYNSLGLLLTIAYWANNIYYNITVESFAFQFTHIPLEILDIILQKSYLHWILYSPIKKKDDDVIRSLISVDVCFNRRITKHRFKKAIWCYLKGEMYSKYYCQTTYPDKCHFYILIYPHNPITITI